MIEEPLDRYTVNISVTGIIHFSMIAPTRNKHKLDEAIMKFVRDEFEMIGLDKLISYNPNFISYKVTDNHDPTQEEPHV